MSPTGSANARILVPNAYATALATEGRDQGPTIVKRRAVLVAPELDRTDEIPAPAATASLADMRAGRYSCGSASRKPAA
jgi:hypothetical protein